MPTLNNVPSKQSIPKSSFRSPVFSKVLAIAILFFACSYPLQMFSPLRLQTDSVAYLRLASSLKDGHGYLEEGRPSRYPPGYPVMIASMEWVGAAKPFVFVGLNCLLLAVGVLAAKSVATRGFNLDRDSSHIVVLMFLASFVVVKLTPYVLTDVPFLAFAFPSLWCAVEAAKSDSRKRFLTYFVCGLVLCVGAILVRSVGVALIPALLWSAIEYLELDRFLLKRSTLSVLVPTAAVISVVFTWWVLMHTIQGRWIRFAYHIQGARTVLLIPLQRLEDLGQIIINLPVSKVPLVRPFSWLAGTIALTLISFAIKRRAVPASILVFLVAYLAMLLIAPWPDPRYWLPLIPFIAAIAVKEVQHIASKLPRVYKLAPYYLAFYCFLGFLAVGYSTRISFSGSSFPDRFGDGTDRATYQLFLLGRTSPGSKIDYVMLRLLERYGRN